MPEAHSSPLKSADPAAPVETCPRCQKTLPLCVCADIEPLDNRIALMVLQHPREQDQDLGTARLTVLHLKKAEFRVGLSWPSLTKALGRPVDPNRWAVLYLGSAKPSDFPTDREVVVLDQKGEPMPNQDRELSEINGVIVLDGSWSQAKTLWWRNAWLLKVKRIALNPRRPSLYGKLRKEPRREALSTLESVGVLMRELDGKPEIETALIKTFARLLHRYHAVKKAEKAAAPPRPRRRRPPARA
jgi:hypothetical protein